MRFELSWMLYRPSGVGGTAPNPTLERTRFARRAADAVTCIVRRKLVTKLEEAAIRAVIAATTEMFNRHDGKGFVRYYTPDADLVTVRGEVMKGTAEIEAGLDRIFQTRAAGATLREIDASIRFLGPGVALAHVTNELSGLVGPGGERLPAHRERSVRVFVKTEEAWKVTAFHNTRLGERPQ